MKVATAAVGSVKPMQIVSLIVKASSIQVVPKSSVCGAKTVRSRLTSPKRTEQTSAVISVKALIRQ